MMGAIAYLVLFVPVVIARPLYRDPLCLEARLMDALLQQFFNIDIMVQAAPLILAGLKQTIIICLIVVPLGLIGGLAVALISLSRWRTARWAVIASIDLFVPCRRWCCSFSSCRAAVRGLRLSPMAAVAIAFFLNDSGYSGEIFRAGIESVGLGQWDAARSTGLRAYQALAYVVLPQAVRNVLPDLVSNTVEVVKLTSIASVVALPELLYSADMARSVTFNSSPIVLAWRSTLLCCGRWFG